MPTRPSEQVTVLALRDPSATSIAVHGSRGWLLVDAGFGAALDATERRMRAAGVAPEDVCLLALTHMHCDHSGGAAGLQARYGTPVALHRTEAALINGRSPDAGDARWLDHPLAPFGVDRPLDDGTELTDHGGPALVTVALGAQTPGHVAFHLPELGLLLTGDLLQEHDVAWLPPGRGHVERGLRALDRLEATGARTAVPGHGPPVPDVPAAIERARTRYTRWLDDPERAAWHAIKRLAVSAVQLAPAGAGLQAAQLARAPSLRSVAAGPIGRDPLDLASAVLAELQRVGALRDTPAGLRATGDHDPPGPHPYGPLRPADWPASLAARAGEWWWTPT